MCVIAPRMATDLMLHPHHHEDGLVFYGHAHSIEHSKEGDGFIAVQWVFLPQQLP